MRIAIIGAMEEEVSLLREYISDKQVVEVAGCEFTSGSIGDKEVVLLKSGIGKVNAAMSTTILLEKFRPDIIINTGSAGGYNPDLTIGDLVISTEVRHHDVDVTIFDYEYGQVPQMPPAFLADSSLIETAQKAVGNIEGIQAVKGLIATGDSFMNDPVRVEFVRNKFPKLQAVEMEAAAIAQVAYQFNVPFVIIRSLSDIAGQESHISFDEFLDKAAVNSANLVLEMVKLL
ncbi:5'-methylthioadenosine/S-adenosylhomocysteine nucleosidase [Lederbergia wuyishanensis]|uniref:5'-methylthioadenosine/S-adenosylhomocysteine nucleosidase n=1 Tax=Lederbergia wuyishanensis TaxID=1347903 RepID=A0ABU0D1M2_9BACI|nr:5'-methylthioadenosine/S-adenosylhomocysteine nucleosidase [Lederbergia wuyishanensis]MCJ8006912.1 5'-methylthioadenosine/S-adenosylhomocysteine nucleosidase [Lederbergia wuyishanensis]MDQ0342296.1 adenosylhomocysteine nucleosidase [Lederbergia wuyishanensis]